jgi:hypothetical protein
MDTIGAPFRYTNEQWLQIEAAVTGAGGDLHALSKRRDWLALYASTHARIGGLREYLPEATEEEKLRWIDVSSALVTLQNLLFAMSPSEARHHLLKGDKSLEELGVFVNMLQRLSRTANELANQDVPRRSQYIARDYLFSKLADFWRVELGLEVHVSNPSHCGNFIKAAGDPLMRHPATKGQISSVLRNVVADHSKRKRRSVRKSKLKIKISA